MFNWQSLSERQISRKRGMENQQKVMPNRGWELNEQNNYIMLQLTKIILKQTKHHYSYQKTELNAIQ